MGVLVGRGVGVEEETGTTVTGVRFDREPDDNPTVSVLIVGWPSVVYVSIDDRFATVLARVDRPGIGVDNGNVDATLEHLGRLLPASVFGSGESEVIVFR